MKRVSSGDKGTLCQGAITDVAAELPGEALSKDELEKLRTERTERLSNALVNLQKSIELKSDYAPAHFLSSQVYERQGNRPLAIEKTVVTRDLNPLDTGVGYQLGLLYYLDEQLEKGLPPETG